VAQLKLDKIDFIPQVDHISIQEGSFVIHDKTEIMVHQDHIHFAEFLQETIASIIEKKVAIVGDSTKDYVFPERDRSEIWIQLKPELNLGLEDYQIEVKHSVTYIQASSINGLSNAVQTFRQLVLIRNSRTPKGITRVPLSISLPFLNIKDYPIYSHRGMLLDCARHFFSVKTVKKYLDLMALYKMNVLHWHLTEDQGWRIQIDKYPKLTEVGAWRIEKDGTKYGGFYTKEEIRDIVKYASKRGITVIPEIELPGHSQAAVASYPWLSCTGEQVEVINDWGVFKEIYCAGNDSVFTFLEDVLTEVMDLFPSKYIHIGGDEAPKYRWEHCDKCQLRIQNEKLKDEHELQSYFIGRIEKFLKSNGRELIGWDEILEGGISKTATVQSWRGIEGGVEAARHGNKVIMSPTSHCYFDYDLKAIDLKKVWEFSPMPVGLEEPYQNNILGGECNLWSERIPNEANLDSKVFPRMMAMAEVLWSGNKRNGFDEFYSRVQRHYPILDKMGVKYGLETIPSEIKTYVIDKKVYATLHSKLPDIKLKYRMDVEEMELDGDYSKYEDYENDTIEVISGSLTVKALKNGKEYGSGISEYFNLHNAVGAVMDYSSKWNKWYEAGGEMALVDGKLGTIDFRDGNWQGFYGEDLEVVLDLGALKEIKSVYMKFYQYQNSWIFYPREITIMISEDGKNYELLSTKKYEEQKPSTKKTVSFMSPSSLDIEEKARYIKVFVKNQGIVPEWHEAAGSKAWLFIDEIIVK
jgi:hexosaminidase